MNVIRLPICGACGKVAHNPVKELGGEFHQSCWNEIAEDLIKVGEECPDPWDDCVIHNYTPSLHSGLCHHCNAPSKEDCLGENLKEVIDICDL